MRTYKVSSTQNLSGITRSETE